MNVREFINAFQRCTSNGWLEWNEALLLVATAEETTGDIVEFGSYMGRSATLLAQLGRMVHCVDPWADGFHDSLSGDDIFSRFVANTMSVARFLSVHRMKVEDWTPIAAGFVYMDGDHTYQGTIAQIEKALACHPDWIACHDCNDTGEGKEIVRACLDRLGSWKERIGKLAVWKMP